MTVLIEPSTLRGLRVQKKWTQGKLAKSTIHPFKVSLPTIKRIEGTKSGLYEANARIAEGLAKALGVEVSNLGMPLTVSEETAEPVPHTGRRVSRFRMDDKTLLAFQMVQHIYGISIQTQIDMAPLFSALLAEGSLAWRKQKVAEIEVAARNLEVLGGGHLSFAYSASRALEGAESERSSIAKRDLFGIEIGDDAFDFGYDPSENNPFADYLVSFSQSVGASPVTLDVGLEWKTEEGMPEYRIGQDIFENITALNRDAEYAILRGHVLLRDIPENLIGDDRSNERVAWIVQQIPNDEMSARLERRERLERLLEESYPKL